MAKGGFCSCGITRACVGQSPLFTTEATKTHVTEMTQELLEVYERLLKRQRSPAAATRQFQHWKHDADLLPKLLVQLDAVLAALNKFEPIVYNTQGILDDGTDVAVRYRTSNQGDEERELIGFQVKSYGDLSKPDCMKDLKAQHDDTFRKVRGLSYYFILLCTDAEKHAKKVQNIQAEFRSAERTKVIEPRLVYTFLNSPVTTAEALVKRIRQADDIVFRNALDSLDQSSPSSQALAIFLAVKAVLTGERQFSEADVLSASDLRRVYGELRDKQAQLIEGALDDNDVSSGFELTEPEDEDDYGFRDEEPVIRIAEFETQITEDLELLETDVIERDSDSNKLILKTEQLRALTAVITDALARYEYTESELMSYMFSVMGVMD